MGNGNLLAMRTGYGRPLSILSIHLTGLLRPLARLTSNYVPPPSSESIKLELRHLRQETPTFLLARNAYDSHDRAAGGGCAPPLLLLAPPYCLPLLLPLSSLYPFYLALSMHALWVRPNQLNLRWKLDIY